MPSSGSTSKTPTQNLKVSSFSNKKKETPNLKDIFKKEVETKREVLIDDSEKRNQAFDIDKLTIARKNYISINKIDGATLSLLKNEFIIKENHEIEIQLKSPIETSLLTKIHLDFVKYFKDELENDFITVTSKVNTINVKKKAYTHAEIFQVMAEKNPNLFKLKEALGLDTEF